MVRRVVRKSRHGHLRRKASAESKSASPCKRSPMGREIVPYLPLISHTDSQSSKEIRRGQFARACNRSPHKSPQILKCHPLP